MSESPSALLASLRRRQEVVSGLLLLFAAAIALLWVNSFGADSYQRLWRAPLSVGPSGFSLTKPAILWVNDLLMAVFFLLVGLEIKREVLEGALSSLRRAALPLLAALGGVVVPAGIYWIVNYSVGGNLNGWAVPAATDIAFALGIVALLGSRAPVALKVFLTAVAVADDLAAIAIIGVFFTSDVSAIALGGAGIAWLLLLGINRAGVRHSWPYVGFGLLLWIALLKSGLHATMAGVLLAICIPARRARVGPGLLVRWEHSVKPWVLFAIVPVFALANAGVSLSTTGQGLGSVGWGVFLGLLVGKPLGITALAWAAVRLRWAELPVGLSWWQLHGAAWLAGIGFTMSLFIGELALQGAALQ